MTVKNEITPELFFKLYTSSGWEPPLMEQIETGIKNSTKFYVAYDGEKPVAMGRIIGDLAMSVYLKDFIVIPEYQGKGVGRFLLEHIQSDIKSMLKPDWAVSLELMSSAGKEKFYEKFGFEAMPNNTWCGSGMFMMIRAPGKNSF